MVGETVSPGGPAGPAPADLKRRFELELEELGIPLPKPSSVKQEPPEALKAYAEREAARFAKASGLGGVGDFGLRAFSGFLVMMPIDWPMDVRDTFAEGGTAISALGPVGSRKTHNAELKLVFTPSSKAADPATLGKYIELRVLNYGKPEIHFQSKNDKGIETLLTREIVGNRAGGGPARVTERVLVGAQAGYIYDISYSCEEQDFKRWEEVFDRAKSSLKPV